METKGSSGDKRSVNMPKFEEEAEIEQVIVSLNLISRLCYS